MIVMNLVAISEMFCQTEISPVELVRESIEKIKEKNPKYNAFITLCEDKAMLLQLKRKRR